MSKRKMGDHVQISGSYQHDAIHHGPAVQRHWHRSKLLMLDELLRLDSTKRVLDVGCGSGVVSAHAASHGAEVLAIDGNPDAIAFAEATYQSPLLRFRHGHVDELRLNREFSVAICLEVIEHLYPAQGVVMLKSIAEALIDGGLLLISTPNYQSVWPVIEFALDRTSMVPHLEGDQHVTKYTHKRLRDACAAAGFETIRERSVCTLGPWAAPISEGAARWLTKAELRHRWPCGTILAHVCRRG